MVCCWLVDEQIGTRRRSSRSIISYKLYSYTSSTYLFFFLLFLASVTAEADTLYYNIDCVFCMLLTPSFLMSYSKYVLLAVKSNYMMFVSLYITFNLLSSFHLLPLFSSLLQCSSSSCPYIMVCKMSHKNQKNKNKLFMCAMCS